MLDDNTVNQEFELYKNETKDDEKETLPVTTQEGEFKDPEQEPPKDPNINPEILAEGALEVTEQLSKQGDVKDQTEKLVRGIGDNNPPSSIDDQGYYSRIVKTITETNQDKMPKEQWANIIKNSKLGVDKNEYNYLKLDTFLQGKDSVNKKELLDFVELNNLAPYIKVESNTYAEAAPQGYDDLYLDYTVSPSFGKHEFITFQVDKDFYNGDIVFQSEHSDRYLSLIHI